MPLAAFSLCVVGGIACKLLEIRITLKKIPKNFRPEPYAYHHELELQIDSLTNLGDGLGRDGAWVIMVPFALPGERVRVRIWRNRANYSEADLLEVLTPASERAEPRCPLFTRCGGCQYQHYSYAGQLEWKRLQVVELLEKLGEIVTQVEPVHPSPLQYHYRSKLTPHFQKPRKPGEPMPIGFQEHGSSMIIDVPQCPIATEAINEVMPHERQLILSGKRKFRKGGTLLLRHTLEGVVSDNNAVVSEKVGDQVFQFIAGEFFQNNPFILPEFVDYGVQQARGEGIRYLVDAYCGVGVFGIAGARYFDRVAGVEVSANAITYARANATINKVSNIEFTVGQAEAIFARIDFPADALAVLIDPPRKGCDRAFLEQLCQLGPRRIVYVSCGPDTQARDLKYLVAEGYRVERVQPFDLFPQTRHIENVATLVR